MDEQNKINEETVQSEIVDDDSTVEQQEKMDEQGDENIKTKEEDKEKQLKELTERWQRLAAEFDNFRKRTIKEKASMYDDGVKDTVEKLLPVIDNFERALSTGKENHNDGFYKGIEMILKQLTEVLASIGVTEIKALGETFNPNFHQAVVHVDDEQYGEGEIIADMQKGYLYKEKVIRPSMVKVAN